MQVCIQPTNQPIEMSSFLRIEMSSFLRSTDTVYKDLANLAEHSANSHVSCLDVLLAG